MKIAILGATSQIAKDLIVSFATVGNVQLHLFARRPTEVTKWLADNNLPASYPVNEFAAFGQHAFDAVINFVGVGNPAQAVAMGKAIFDITAHFDDMVLNYLQHHPDCRYLFLSSGAVYGSNFNEPVTQDTPAWVNINALKPQEWYGVAKLHAECRHRAHAERAIIDIRVFNYFSHTQDLSARFLMTDILRAIRDNTVLQTSADYIVRDFVHPSDFYQLVNALLTAPPANTAVDCYSRAPIDKLTLLTTLQAQFGLRYKVDSTISKVNATGNKPYYYSRSTRAAEFGYQPTLTSLEGVVRETVVLLQQFIY